MTAFLKIEFETQNLENVEQVSAQLNQALVSSFADVGLNQLDSDNEVMVSLEEPEELALVETAVVLGLVGLAKSLVELYKYLKEKELEEKKLDLERAKLELEKLPEQEKQRLRDDFVKDDLPRILQQANITNVYNIGTSIMVQG